MPQENKMRQIVIETDGRQIKLIKVEASQIEFMAIMGIVAQKAGDLYDSLKELKQGENIPQK